MSGRGNEVSVGDAIALVRARDVLVCGFVAGQPAGFLEALGARTDLEDVAIYTGLLAAPYALLGNPRVHIVSGFFGPIERMARGLGGAGAGARISYLPADFNGLEHRAIRLEPRVALAVTTPPDADGWMSFGIQAGASYRPFLDAVRDPQRIAIAEANAHMPRVDGLPELGGNRVHVSQVSAWYRHDAEPVVLPVSAPSAEDAAIARHASALIPSGAILQFGIGSIPDEIARILAEGPGGGYGIHTEMISDGVMHLHRAGKVANRKPLYGGVSVATFALGSAELYRWLDGNPDVRILPVTDVNETGILRQLPGLVSVNGALAVDLAGQVAADALEGRQYSGTGGHESFVAGTGSAPGGRSLLCMRSTATVHGKRLSTIVAALPARTMVTTPRHHTQWIVTEHGAVDLSVLTDDERPAALIGIAHPDFRDELRNAFA